MENQILLEKIGETRTDKLIIDCNKIYMEKFRKEFPNYFESNYLKSIAKVIITPKESNEIKGIGMSCINDLMSANFAKWLGGFIGNTNQTTGEDMKNVPVGGNFPCGFSHGGGNGSMWGSNEQANRGMNFSVSNATELPTKEIFTPPPSTSGQSLLTNSGTFSAGLNTVTWSAGNSSQVNPSFFISNANVLVPWSRNNTTSATWLLLADSISPTVEVIFGESIFLEYTFQFS